MSEIPSFIADRLRAEGEKMVTFFSTLTDDQWQKTVYTEGAEWNIRDVLAHFVSTEKSLLKLFHNINNGGPGAPDDFSVGRFNVSQVVKLQGVSQRELMDEYISAREEMIIWVSSLSETDLEKTGRHPFLGQTTIVGMVKMVYRHNQIHYRDLRRILDD